MNGASTWLIYIIMLIAGIGIPVMAAMNASLGQQLGSPVKAAFILFCVGLVTVFIVLTPKGLPTVHQFKSIPIYYFLGGVLVAFYILSMTWAAPQIGVGTAVFLVLVGQLFTAAFLEHYGLLGNLQSPISLRRILGLAFIIVGVYLARRL